MQPLRGMNGSLVLIQSRTILMSEEHVATETGLDAPMAMVWAAARSQVNVCGHWRAGLIPEDSWPCPS